MLTRRKVVGIAGAVVVLLGSALIGYRGIYGEWPWTTYPAVLHLCGRDFQPSGGEQTREQIAAEGDHLVRHGDTPGPLNFDAVWTFDIADGHRIDPLPGGCQVVMWVQGGDDAYRAYALEGGP